MLFNAAAVVDHPTSATSISSPQSTFQALQAVRDSSGAVHTVGEDEIADSVALAARCEGVLLENAAAAGLAALRAHRARGLLPADTEVVLVASSTGLKSLGGRLDRPLDAPEVDDVSALQALTREQEEHRR